MKTLFSLLLVHLAVTAQTKGIVRDSLSGKPVPYVNIWLEGKDSGTTADSLGQFAVNTTNADARIVFSAPGYAAKTILLQDIRHLRLSPLEPIKAEPTVETQTEVIGGYKKGDIALYYGSQGKPWMLARKFEAQNPATPILKSVRLATECHNNNMKFELRVFAVAPDGNPGRDLIGEPVIFRVDRGREEQDIDLTKYGVRMPENGVFVAVCWMMIPQNLKKWYDHRPMAYWDFDPGIGAMPSETNETWAYTLGRWQPVPAKPEDYDIRKFRGKFTALALALTLTN